MSILQTYCAYASLDAYIKKNKIELYDGVSERQGVKSNMSQHDYKRREPYILHSIDSQG